MTVAVELAPIVKTIEVARSADDAFRLFTSDIDAWWPKASHSRAKNALGQTTQRVTLEPRIGGRVFETINTGEELDWGEVIGFEPGRRFAMIWQMGRARDRSGEVEVSFAPLDAARCRVTLTHSGWDRIEDGASERNGYNNGWKSVFGECFRDFANAQ